MARMSSVTVTRMKMIAAGRDFMRVEHERNVVAAVVSTAEHGRNCRLICYHMTMPLSYISPKTGVRESKIHGRGLFAIADIGKDEIVAVKGGHIIDRKTLREEITPTLGSVEIQIDDYLFIAPVTREKRELSMLYSNHLCELNLGIRGENTFVAMRNVYPGEELTHDWAMTDDDDYFLKCNCGAAIAEKFSPAKIGNARICRSAMPASFQPILPTRSRGVVISLFKAFGRPPFCRA
jgi:uncharacterized protein